MKEQEEHQPKHHDPEIGEGQIRTGPGRCTKPETGRRAARADGCRRASHEPETATMQNRFFNV